MNTNLLKKIKRKYFNSKPITASYYNRGLNEKYIIRNNGNVFLFKTYDLNWVESILNFEKRFRRGGFDVILPLKNTNDSYYIRIDKKRAGVLYPYISGGEILRRNKNRLFLAGAFLGELHNFGSINFNNGKWDKVSSNLFDINYKKFILRSGINNNSKVIKSLNKKISCLKKSRVEILNLKYPPKNSYLHGDFHLKNILTKNNKFLLFDFEHSRVGNRELDLIRTIFSVCFQSKFTKRSFGYAESFCRGYLSKSSISYEKVSMTISFYLYDNMIMNTWYEDKILEKNAKNLSMLYRLLSDDLKTISYLSNNFDTFKMIMTNFL
ncbi:MAG: hypothetical protein AB201_02035 [Parcubacteria bacterium C7867-006]|nr:MAG: hypothetical protein AB201_02035 [Parcubacteria bacterium C7867-006]